MRKKIVACAFGSLLTAMWVPVAAAHADSTDSDFTNFLQSQGIRLGSASQTVTMARVMCQDLDAGYTQKDEIDQLTGSQRLNQSQAATFVGAATADYCPKHHNGTRPGK